MIRVEFEPAELVEEQAEWWKGWEVKAQRATDDARDLVAAQGSVEFRSRVWKELKEWLFKNVFSNKCAYCEGRVTPQAFGDAEHWRPKAAVKCRQKGRLRAVEVEGKKHPGYWWLAYHWSNLLPACEKCNTGRGKGNQFPIAGEYVCEPGEGESIDEIDAREKPLLLHPFRGEDPIDHLGFNEFGQVFAIRESPFGEASIEVFDLERDELTEDRYEQLQKAEDGFLRAATTVMYGNVTFSEAIDRVCRDSSEYSAAVRQHATRWLKSFIRKMRA